MKKNMESINPNKLYSEITETTKEFDNDIEIIDNILKENINIFKKYINEINLYYTHILGATNISVINNFDRINELHSNIVDKLDILKDMYLECIHISLLSITQKEECTDNINDIRNEITELINEITELINNQSYLPISPMAGGKKQNKRKQKKTKSKKQKSKKSKKIKSKKSKKIKKY